jgi:sugar phosphate isomerase/epimerase
VRIGIMTDVFQRSTLEEMLDAIVAHAISSVQFSLTNLGMPYLPESIDRELCDRIRNAMAARRITMAAVSGTFNMIHPDRQQRGDGLRRLRVLASACDLLGTSTITLCTGTRDPNSMWRSHPQNDSSEAWDDLAVSMEAACRIADEQGVTIAFEPEVSNVVDSAQKARRLLDQMQSPHLKLIMDPANIFHRGELARMREILDEAFDLLGDDIALAHAKDLSEDGEAGHEAAGEGLLDYDQYLSLLSNAAPEVPLILHGLSEAQVPGCIAFLNQKLDRI